MTKSIEEKVKALTEKARRVGSKRVKPLSAVRNGSSLHRIIRTKEQADRLMKLLQSS